MKYFLAFLLILAGCNAPASVTPEPATNPVTMLQDLEGCNNQPDTPWCESACKDSSYTWCKK